MVVLTDCPLRIVGDRQAGSQGRDLTAFATHGIPEPQRAPTHCTRREKEKETERERERARKRQREGEQGEAIFPRPLGLALLDEPIPHELPPVILMEPCEKLWEH